jgi:iron complex outermembrane receptor protein
VRSTFTRAAAVAARVALVPPLVLASTAGAQGVDSTAAVELRVTAEARPLADAIVRSGRVGASTDAAGAARIRLRAGPQLIVVGKLGFAADTLRLVVRAGRDTTLTAALEPEAAELAGVVVSATRGERRVEGEPTRVEVIGEDEIQEQISMSPGNVAMLLSETGGARVAATSPALGGSNVRVQGLRGRYTQLLSDGLPLYGLSTDGLGLLQIPPVDLQQLEIIKGAASALYGPTALGGVVNLVSRRPDATREVLANQTSRDGTDLVLWDAQRLSESLGYTLLASGHRQRRQDLDGDGWADMAGYGRAVVRPRLFWTSARGHSLFATAGGTAENRAGGRPTGGALPGDSAYAQNLRTRRGDAGAVARVLLGDASVLSARASATLQRRALLFGADRDRERRATVFAEVALARQWGAQSAVAGAAVQRDRYRAPTARALDYAFTAPALFAQHTWTPTERAGVTTSARLDHHSRYGTFLSPRVSALVRPAPNWTARVSAGGGVYTPTPFTEETEELALARVAPPDGVRAERARSASVDVNGSAGPLELSGSVYGSEIRDATGLLAEGGAVRLVNAGGPTRTRGAELFGRYRRGAASLTGTYAYTRATEVDPNDGARRGVPLTPRHAVGAVAGWEEESGSRVGLEYYYTGRQPLDDNPFRTTGKPYSLLGLLVQKRVGPALLFVNGENLFDVRQTRYDPLLRPAAGAGGRRTTDAWAPLDGRVFNAGVRWAVSGAER